MSESSPAHLPSLEYSGRVAVITGASRGIGRAVALSLAARGAHVVAVARTAAALEELDDAIVGAGGTRPLLVPLDVTDFDAIDRLGAVLYERFGRVDVLVGNAGILGPLSPLGHIEVKDWDKVMAVNVTANWRLIRSLDVLLRRSDAGRALFVTSGAAQKTRAYWGPYSVSKAALEALVKTYAHETLQTQVTVNLLNPGPLRTRMRAAAMPGEDPETLKTPEELAPYVADMLTRGNQRTGQIFDFPSLKWNET